MTVAAIVVAPAPIVETAEDWARAGLVADSWWVVADGFPGVDPDSPNAVKARHLRFGHLPTEEPLALGLARVGTMDEARVVWVRGADGATDELAELAGLLRELLPRETTHWLDIVVPRRRTDDAIVPLAGEWVQFCVHPSDRPGPDMADAGWDLDLAVPLHTTLVLAGILGGTTTVLPWARKDAGRYHMARVFSRLVDGGAEAHEQSANFLAAVAPVTHAAEQHPTRFLAADPQQAADLTDSALDWMIRCGDGALTYTPDPTLHLADPPNLTLGRHLRYFFRFIPFGLRTLVWGGGPRIRLGSLLEFDDLGHSVGEDALPATTGGVPDFADLEARAIAVAAQRIAQHRVTPDGSALTAVWEPVARVTTSLIDGGTGVPDDWKLPVAHGDRQLTVATGAVLMGAREPVDSPVPELTLAENPQVAVLALTEARRSHGDAVGGPLGVRRVTATARRLATEANHADAESRSEQLSALGSVQESSRPASLLERIRGHVLGGLIRSRLDAARWTALATTLPTGAPPDWLKVSRPYRWAFLIWVSALLLLGLVWWKWHVAVAAAMAMHLGLIGGLGILGGMALLALATLVYLLFRAWAAFMEQGRRRLELLGLWLRRALAAATASARQGDAERTARAWVGLLSDVPGLAEAAVVPEPPAPQRVPMAMDVGHPLYSTRAMSRWLADAGAKPGWRLRTLQEVISQFSGNSPDQSLSWLAQDSALPGGRLSDLSAVLADEMRTLNARSAREMTQAVKARMIASPNCELSRLPRGEEDRQALLPAFLNEVLPVSDDDWPDDDQHRWTIEAGASAEDAPVIRLTEALCTARVTVGVVEMVLDDPAEQPEAIIETNGFR